MTCKQCLHNEMCHLTHTNWSPGCCDFYGWINADERSPDAEYAKHICMNGADEGMPVIVMIGGAIESNVLYYDGADFVDRNGMSYAITHWMPLPSALQR